MDDKKIQTTSKLKKQKTMNFDDTIEETYLNNDIGARLKEFRKSLGKSQVDFANKLGVAPSYISKLEKGKKHITPFVLDSLITKCFLDPDWLMHGLFEMKDELGASFFELFHTVALTSLQAIYIECDKTAHLTIKVWGMGNSLFNEYGLKGKKYTKDNNKKNEEDNNKKNEEDNSKGIMYQKIKLLKTSIKSPNILTFEKIILAYLDCQDDESLKYESLDKFLGMQEEEPIFYINQLEKEYIKFNETICIVIAYIESVKKEHNTARYTEKQCSEVRKEADTRLSVLKKYQKLVEDNILNIKIYVAECYDEFILKDIIDWCAELPLCKKFLIRYLFDEFTKAKS